MVKRTQTIRREIADDLFECVWQFCWIGAWRHNNKPLKPLNIFFVIYCLIKMIESQINEHVHSSISCLAVSSENCGSHFFFSFFSYFPLKKQGSLKKHDQKNISTTRTTGSAHTIKVDNTVHLRLVLTLPKEKW